MIKNLDMFLSTAIKPIQIYQIDTCQNRYVYLDTDQMTEFVHNHMHIIFIIDYIFSHNSNPIGIVMVRPVVGHEVS